MVKEGNKKAARGHVSGWPEVWIQTGPFFHFDSPQQRLQSYLVELADRFLTLTFTILFLTDILEMSDICSSNHRLQSKHRAIRGDARSLSMHS